MAAGVDGVFAGVTLGSDLAGVVAAGFVDVAGVLAALPAAPDAGFVAGEVAVGVEGVDSVGPELPSLPHAASAKRMGTATNLRMGTSLNEPKLSLDSFWVNDRASVSNTGVYLLAYPIRGIGRVGALETRVISTHQSFQRSKRRAIGAAFSNLVRAWGGARCKGTIGRGARRSR
jgi:hypothetical protein